MEDPTISGAINALMNWDTDYMEKAKESGKNDRIFEMWYGVPYVDKKGEPEFTPIDTNKDPNDIFIEPDIQAEDVEGGSTTTAKKKYRPVW